jgi:hypothetical protein
MASGSLCPAEVIFAAKEVNVQWDFIAARDLRHSIQMAVATNSTTHIFGKIQIQKSYFGVSTISTISALLS